MENELKKLLKEMQSYVRYCTTETNYIGNTSTEREWFNRMGDKTNYFAKELELILTGTAKEQYDRK